MMVKTTCVCDRCGKTFDEVNSKTVKIVSARAERKKESQEPKKAGLFLWPFRLFEQIHGKRFLPGVYRRN